MAQKVWVGGTDANFDTAANWDPSGVPVDDDTLLFNDKAEQALTGNIDSTTLASKAFSIVATSGFKYHIGESGTEFTPGDGYTTVIFNGTGTIPSYLEVDTGDTMSRCIVNSPSARDDLLILNGAGSIDQLTVMNGRAKLNSTTITSGGWVQVLGNAGGGGSAGAQLVIDSGCTLTGTEIGVSGGLLTCSSSAVDLLVTGGELVLDASAGVTGTLKMRGGTTWWDAISTIAKGEIFGGSLAIRKDRAGRTLTAANVYPGGTIDFRTGGLSVTHTNPIRNLGGQYLYPLGASVTVAV